MQSEVPRLDDSLLLQATKKRVPTLGPGKPLQVTILEAVNDIERIVGRVSNIKPARGVV